ncbi:hypothetical protein LZ30DRAFT_819190, partial [Colletotrichum cereale]
CPVSPQRSPPARRAGHPSTATAHLIRPRRETYATWAPGPTGARLSPTTSRFVGSGVPSLKRCPRPTTSVG